MRSSLGAKRQARKIGQDEDEGGEDARPGLGSQEEGMTCILFMAAQISDSCIQTYRLTAYPENTPTVIRPAIPSRGSSKTKKRSSLRMSFGPGGTSMTEEDGDGESAVFTAKKSNLSRQAIEKNALRKTLAANFSSEHAPLRQNEDRPSYNSDYLKELKTSTPSTPKNLSAHTNSDDEAGKELDLAAKFGSDLSVYDSKSGIPTNAEIQEKKERRVRLAKAPDFMSLVDDDDGDEQEQGDEDSDGERALLPYALSKPLKQEETRLVRDDEDIAEGFDDFVSDGRIALGKKAEREQKRRHEAEMRELINEAEGGNSSDDSDDDSEKERLAAYEAAQTRKGMDGLKKADEGARPKRPKTPPRITPLPTLAGCLERLKGQLEAKQLQLRIKRKRMEEIQKEKNLIKEREVEIQQLLKEAGEKYEKLKAEAEEQGSNGVGGGQMVVAGGEGMAARGLENLGNT
ncbi:hypothetical protein P7C71_g5732, partial [Lecanoromycetidae sp. Uapishka_2]